MLTRYHQVQTSTVIQYTQNTNNSGALWIDKSFCWELVLIWGIVHSRVSARVGGCAVHILSRKWLHVAQVVQLTLFCPGSGNYEESSGGESEVCSIIVGSEGHHHRIQHYHDYYHFCYCNHHHLYHRHHCCKWVTASGISKCQVLDWPGNSLYILAIWNISRWYYVLHLNPYIRIFTSCRVWSDLPPSYCRIR